MKRITSNANAADILKPAFTDLQTLTKNS